MLHSLDLARRAAPVLSALALASLLAACVDPLDITTPKRVTEVDLDSIVASDTFVNAPGDSLEALVGGQKVIFATAVARPFHNGIYRSAHYVTVQASRQTLSSPDYEIFSLRLDAITDTGTYHLNGPYSAPKKVDSTAPPTYAAQYERRNGGGFPATFRTGADGTSGSIRVARIDTARNVMTGTFSLTAFCAELDSTITITSGAFRVQLVRR